MIDRATVEKIAHLARLEIKSSEEEQFALQLSGILDYFEQLSELDTENVPPTTRAIEIQNITRADSNRLYPDHEVLVQESPVPEGDYFRVPRILNTDEEWISHQWSAIIHILGITRFPSSLNDYKFSRTWQALTAGKTVKQTNLKRFFERKYSSSPSVSLKAVLAMMTSIVVLKTHYVILSQIFPILHFN